MVGLCQPWNPVLLGKGLTDPESFHKGVFGLPCEHGELFHNLHEVRPKEVFGLYKKVSKGKGDNRLEHVPLVRDTDKGVDGSDNLLLRRRANPRRDSQPRLIYKELASNHLLESFHTRTPKGIPKLLSPPSSKDKLTVFWCLCTHLDLNERLMACMMSFTKRFLAF